MTETTANAPLPGQDTLVASWNAVARTSFGATVVQSPRAIVASFPSFAPMNNAIMLGVHDVDLAAETKKLTTAYARAGVSSWAVWIPSPATSFEAEDTIHEIDGLRSDTTTLVMETKNLTKFRTSTAARAALIATAVRAGDEPVPVAALHEPSTEEGPAGWVIVDDDVAVAGAYRFLHGSDCGIYAVGTAPASRPAASPEHSSNMSSPTLRASVRVPQRCNPRRWPNVCTSRWDSSPSAATRSGHPNEP
jgi:hypothetical protein